MRETLIWKFQLSYLERELLIHIARVIAQCVPIELLIVLITFQRTHVYVQSRSFFLTSRCVSVDGNLWRNGRCSRGAISSSRLDLPLDVPGEGYRVIKYPFWTADFMEFRWKYAPVAPFSLYITPIWSPT